MPQKLANASKAADGALGKVTDGASKARREAQDKPARGGGFRLRVASLLTVLFAAFAAVVLVLQMPSALVVLLGRDAAGGAGAQRARCRAYVDADALRRCSPHERWADWTDDLAFAVRQGAAGRAADSTQFAARKAAALLLTVRGGSAAEAEAALLSTFRTDCGGCQLLIDASLVHTAGDLQRRFVDFLRKCPEGVALVTGVEALPWTSLAPLNAAMGEHGAFEDSGEKVVATGATFVLTMADDLVRASLPEGEAGEYDESAFMRAAKAMLSGMLQERCDAGDERCQGTVSALRRRLDFVGEFDVGAEGCAVAGSGL